VTIRPVHSFAFAGLRALHVRIAEIGVVVEGLTADLGQRLTELVRPFETDAPIVHPDVRIEVKRVPRHSGWLIVQNGAVRRSIQDSEKLLGYLEWCIVAQALEAASAYAVFHAATVTREQATAMLVAESGSGKTTLTTSLIQRGWLPLADDISLVHPSTAEVHPFPRCFHADDFTASIIGTPSLFEQPGALNGYIRPVQWATDAARPTCIVRLERDAQTATAAHRITQAEAAGALLSASIGRRPGRSEAARAAVALAAGARACWHLNNSDLSETIDFLERICASGLDARNF
jgi:hypothetical protein